ncbi:MAG: YIP1 family protein [Arenimonas sp.]
MSHLLNIFLEPGKVFNELKEKPTWLVPVLLLTVLTMVMTFMYFMKVDSAWFVDHSIAASGKEMSAAEIAQYKKIMPGAKMMGYIGTGTIPFTMAIVISISALYYFMAGKITGTTIGFKHALSLVSWSSMPMVLGSIVAIVGVITMSPQTSFESINLLNFDPLVMQIPLDSPWSKLAKSFNLLSFWCVFLTALGWKTWGKTSWLQAIVVAIIPSLLIYGGMAVWAMI